jgi:hypothetical protein
MSGKSIPLSFRVTDDDAEFLSGLEIPGAVTPSEKLRALITRARLEHEKERTYEGSLLRVRELLEPTSHALRAHELSSRQRSELMADTLYWLPDLVAYLMAGPETTRKGTEDMRSYAAGVAHRIFRFIEAIMRLGVTAKAPCYDPDLVANGLAGTLELSQVIAANRLAQQGEK